MPEEKDVHVVEAGDTLSAIAQQYYGDGTEPSWRRIYEFNLATIGGNPDMLMPGQRLTIPPAPPKEAGPAAKDEPAHKEAKSETKGHR